MLPLALVLLAAAPASSNAALVWGGGKSRADAERWAKSFTQAQAPFATLFTLEPGYPRIVESAKVKGMKPGFHVVLLGVCPTADLSPRLKLFKAIYSGTYARKVGADVACPKLAAKVKVTHSDSVTADDTVLTLSQLETPKGELLRATHVSRAGAFLATEGFDTPRSTAAACLGGFRQVGTAFEVTLCETTKERNICCAAQKLTTLSVVSGAMKSQAGAAPPPSVVKENEKGKDDAPDCTSQSMAQGFVLEECVDGEITHGEGFTERQMSGSIRLERNGKEVGRTTLGNWSNGWEWATKWSVIGTLALEKGKTAAVIARDDYGEGDGLGSKSAAAFAYGPDLDVLWTAEANEMRVTVQGGTISVKSRTYVSGEPGSEEVAEDEYTLEWKGGALVRQP